MDKYEFLASLLVTFVFSVLLFLLLPVAGVTLGYWICLLISAVLVYGGVLILDDF
jgi:hypothetical protein